MSRSVFVVLAALIMLLSQCGIKKEGGSAKVDDRVSYSRDLAPLLIQSCTPCHFPERGRAEMLDNYDRVRSHIREIVFRTQLDPENEDYMPFKQKKPAWTADEIALFQQWQAEGFAP